MKLLLATVSFPILLIPALCQATDIYAPTAKPVVTNSVVSIHMQDDKGDECVILYDNSDNMMTMVCEQWSAMK